jgi:hypothetical protein
MTRNLSLLAVIAAAALPVTATAQGQEGSVTLIDRDGFSLKFGADVGVQAVTQHNAFWSLGLTFAPGSGYNQDPTWGEAYVKPYLTFSSNLGSMEAYGKLSFVASANIGTDVFDVDAPSAVELEDAFVGVRNGAFDFSVGSQPYQVGTGMLIADGGGDGFERGNIIFGPRRAWELTAIGRYTFGQGKVEAFYLDARELESNDTKSTIAGVSMTYDIAEGRSLGVAVGTVPESEALWIQAAPGGVGVPAFISNGRDGLRFLTAWGTWAVDQQLNLAADFAFQSNDKQDMSAWAGRVQITYSLPDVRFQPRIGYTYQTFSGDDPDTTELERFDPLFYDGSPAAWGSGSNASLVFLNTNIAAHQIWAAATVSPRDFVTVRYYNVRANELLSPLQYGQGTRLDPSGTATLITGVTDSHLSDDLYFEYTRVVRDNAFLTAGVGISKPGAGMRALGAVDTWTGGYVNLVMKF